MGARRGPAARPHPAAGYPPDPSISQQGLGGQQTCPKTARLPEQTAFLGAYGVGANSGWSSRRSQLPSGWRRTT
jgi:hypothetical protein